MTNKELEVLFEKTFKDFAEYFNAKPTKEISDLNESIDTLLTHMEEFCGLLEIIRNGNDQNLSHLLETMQSKIQHCNQLCDMVNKLERIVSRVVYELDRMEEEVSRAEQVMGSKTTIRKLLSFITNSGSTRNQERIKFTPPDIYKTSELIQL